ncbi:MAG: 30S ribosomal protein S20 [Deltaproteobacteria bacterium]|nr:30S ribosomal protein S20 [Deltaproteobacteria bacterium]MCL4236059.1 30S ribosomal protein S20 [Deltaproteobacteria bacterium]
MANHDSAVKRNRQNKKRNERNRFVRATVRSAAKKVMVATDAGEKEGITDLLKDAASKLSKAASKGVVKKQTASRKISRLARRVHSLASA